MRLQDKVHYLQKQVVKESQRGFATPLCEDFYPSSPFPFKSQSSANRGFFSLTGWIFGMRRKSHFLKQHYTQLITLNQVPKY